MSSTLQHEAPKRRISPGFYAAIVLCLIVLGGFAAMSLTSGGLPGTKDSPSATVKGQSTVGKTAAD